MTHDANTSDIPTEESLPVAEEVFWRHPRGWQRFVTPAIAVAWSLFQLSTASFLILDSLVVRAIHLAFALAIIFLNRPLFKKPRFGIRSLCATDSIPWFDFGLAILAAAAALYVILDYEGLSGRQGRPIARDVLAGLILMILLLEGCRRAVGPALSIIALFFCAYALFGAHMPAALAFKSVSMDRLIGQLTMGDAGVYGTPLRVSARTVFLFVLFGALLERAGAGRYFTQLAMSLLGGFRGGPAKAAVLSSGLTGAVSGSSIANVVTTGTFTIPLMKSVGYSPQKAAAIEVAASTDGQLAPPIMGAAAFIIAEYLSVPYIAVVKAAAVPAFASYAALLWITHLEACKLGLRRIPRRELPRFWLTLVSGVHYLAPVFFLIYQLVWLQHTPERAAFWACLAMIGIMILEPPLKAFMKKEPQAPAWKQAAADLIAGLANGGRNMVAVALATAGAGIIVGIVALGPGQLITAVVEHISMGNLILMLIVTAIASLLIGMGLPTTATYITMAALTAPVIVGIAEIHNLTVPLIAAHLFVFFFGILADDTPPVGLAAYAASAIARSDPISTGIQAFLYDIRTAILPFMFIFNADLILHNINSWPRGLLVFGMACFANFAFISATQGWLVTKARWYEIPVLLAAAFVLFRPDYIARRLAVPQESRYWMYLIGLALFFLVAASHLWRMQRSAKIAR